MREQPPTVMSYQYGGIFHAGGAAGGHAIGAHEKVAVPAEKINLDFLTGKLQKLCNLSLKAVGLSEAVIAHPHFKEVA